MAFCTLVEWHHFDLAAYHALAAGAGVSPDLPEGCLSNVVGAVEAGVCVVEVWRSQEDAARFGQQQTASVAGFPPPSRVAGFEADATFNVEAAA